jgi:hypothetical protein
MHGLEKWEKMLAVSGKNRYDSLPSFTDGSVANGNRPSTGKNVQGHVAKHDCVFLLAFYALWQLTVHFFATVEAIRSENLKGRDRSADNYVCVPTHCKKWISLQ